MSEQKQPKAGEWWWVDEVLYIVGYTSSGNFIIEFAGGKTDFCLPLRGYEFETWRHLPNCTGWDWVEPKPEVWPKYYESKHGFTCDAAYVFRDSANSAWMVSKDGAEEFWGWEEKEAGHVTYGRWVEISEDQAKARLKPTPETRTVTLRTFLLWDQVGNEILREMAMKPTGWLHAVELCSRIIEIPVEVTL